MENLLSYLLEYNKYSIIIFLQGIILFLIHADTCQNVLQFPSTLLVEIVQLSCCSSYLISFNQNELAVVDLVEAKTIETVYFVSLYLCGGRGDVTIEPLPPYYFPKSFHQWLDKINSTEFASCVRDI